MADIERYAKRPCCVLLQTFYHQLNALKDPQMAAEALQTLQTHCVLLKSFGMNRTKIDIKSDSGCYLVVQPDTAQSVIDEVAKTVAVDATLANYDNDLLKLYGILAHNEKLQQLSQRHLFLLEEERKVERQISSAPFTDMTITKQNPMAEFQASDRLKAHPVVSNKIQFNGTSDAKNIANPKQHPDAEKNAEALQHQLQNRPQPAFVPRPKMPGQS